jgi:hypothetical protein
MTVEVVTEEEFFEGRKRSVSKLFDWAKKYFWGEDYQVIVERECMQGNTFRIYHKTEPFVELDGRIKRINLYQGKHESLAKEYLDGLTISDRDGYDIVQLSRLPEEREGDQH